MKEKLVKVQCPLIAENWLFPSEDPVPDGSAESQGRV